MRDCNDDMVSLDLVKLIFESKTSICSDKEKESFLGSPKSQIYVTPKRDSLQIMTLSLPQCRRLQPDARSGHVAVFHKGSVVIFGGYTEILINGERQDKFMPTDEIWIFDTERSVWNKAKTKGNHPASGISGATSCVFNDCIIIFGGFGDSFGRLSLVFELNLITLNWRNLTMEGGIRGPYPSARDKLICWQYQNKIVYFGGFGPPPKEDVNGCNGKFCFDREPWGHFEGIGWNSDVCVLQYSASGEFSWLYPQIESESPSPRAAHAGCKIKNLGYVFGGRYDTSRQNDMYYLDLDNYNWHRVKYNSGAPVGRSWHILQNMSDHHLLMYGGLDSNGKTLSDMWIFDIQTGIWKEIEDNSKQPDTRIWHTAVSTDTEGEAIIFGGCFNSVLAQEPSCHTNNVMVIRITPLPLQDLCFAEVVKLLPNWQREEYSIPKHIKRRLSKYANYIDSDSHVKCRMGCALL